MAKRALVRVLHQLELGARGRRTAPRARPARPALDARADFPGPHRLARGPRSWRGRRARTRSGAGEPVAPGRRRISFGLGRLLEPGGDVDRIPGRERRLDVVGHDLARLDADPRLQPEVVDGLEDAQAARSARSASSSWRRGIPNAAMHGVAGELLDLAAVRVMQSRDTARRSGRPPAHDLGIRCRDERRRVDDVDEEHCRELAFHAHDCRNVAGGPGFPPEAFKPSRSRGSRSASSSTTT